MCFAMGNVMLFILKFILLSYYAGSGVNTVQVLCLDLV